MRNNSFLKSICYHYVFEFNNPYSVTRTFEEVIQEAIQNTEYDYIDVLYKDMYVYLTKGISCTFTPYDKLAIYIDDTSKIVFDYDKNVLGLDVIRTSYGFTTLIFMPIPKECK